ncbi:MAG: TorF family putative porin [Proteobacteria bacterium]|nr:TorF family putative porin [Pseudomonadota bacterium]MDA1060033.1 TorF family putative porin [Pseudomonadota bacterium]
MKTTGKILTAMLSTALFSGTAIAQDSANNVSGNVTLASDYVYRGISQTEEGPAIQGGFDYAHASGIYVGVWGSNLNFQDSNEATIEIDVYGGISRDLAMFSSDARTVSWDIGALHYDYPAAAETLNYDFNEVYGGLSLAQGPFEAGIKISHSPNFFADSQKSTYYALTTSWATKLPWAPTFSGGIGRQKVENNTRFGSPDYTDWNLGLSVSVAGVDLSLTYFDTDLKKAQCASTENCEPRGVFAISKSF